MTEYVIEFHHTCDDRVVGWATCGVCGFKAALVDDTQDDVDRFLTDVLVTHARELHGAYFTDKDHHGEAP
jgi:hypothetical protein